MRFVLCGLVAALFTFTHAVETAAHEVDHAQGIVSGYFRA